MLVQHRHYTAAIRRSQKGEDAVVFFVLVQHCHNTSFRQLAILKTRRNLRRPPYKPVSLSPRSSQMTMTSWQRAELTFSYHCSEHRGSQCTPNWKVLPSPFLRPGAGFASRFPRRRFWLLVVRPGNVPHCHLGVVVHDPNASNKRQIGRFYLLHFYGQEPALPADFRGEEFSCWWFVLAGCQITILVSLSIIQSLPSGAVFFFVLVKHCHNASAVRRS